MILNVIHNFKQMATINRDLIVVDLYILTMRDLKSSTYYELQYGL